jgi:TonB-dependent starch-binding outer membrane protein SusC
MMKKKSGFMAKIAHDPIKKRQTGKMVIIALMAILIQLSVPFSMFAAEETSAITTREAQQSTVRGVVTDAAGGTLPGVNVIVRGTTLGTVTNFNGEYTLQVPAPDAVLVFSFIGFTPQEVPVENRATINIVLQESAIALDEVVAVGYGTMRREDITSSVVSVRAEDFNPGTSNNPMDLIQGRVAGLTISRTSFDPNASANIQLRGVSSVNAGRSPLIIIDGVPGADMSSLSPDEIESIEVLKDGSAAAIYGTRGTNGVILITTRSGRSTEVAQFDYSSYVQTETISNRLNVLSADQYRELIAQGDLPPHQDHGHSTDWYNELLRTPVTHNHNFAMTGGTQNTQYRASVFFRDAQPIVMQTSRRNFGGRVSLNHTGLDDRWTVQMNLQNTFIESSNTDYGAFEQAITRNPTSPVWDPENPGLYHDPTGQHNYFNPVARLNQYQIGDDRNLFMGSIRNTLKIADGLEASLMYSFENNTTKRHEYITRDSYQSRNDGYAGQAFRRDRFWQNNTLDMTLNYTLQNVDRHRINLLAGYSYQDFTFDEFHAQNRDFMSDATNWYDMGAGRYLREGMANMGTHKNESTLIGFFGRVNYSLDDKYLLTASMRYEGSSKFGRDNKWGAFPAVSVGWRVNNEDFMQNVDFVNNLRVRLGYGETGNQDFGPYQSLVTLQSFGSYYDHITGRWITGWGPAQNPNPMLRWERKKELNLGMDFAMFNNVFSGSIDLYERTTEDLLFNYDAPMPPNVHSSIFTNVGTMVNRGVEIFAEAVVLNRNDLRLTTSVNWSYLHNELTRLSDETYSLGYIQMYGLPAPGSLGDAMRLEEGKRVGSYYGYKHHGFTEDGNWLFYKQDGSIATPNEMSLDDRQYIGNGLPKMNGGLNANLSYRNWDLNVFFRGEFMYDILNMKPMYYANRTLLASYNQLEDLLDKYSHINAAVQYSDYYLERGDYVKLDNLSIAYTFNIANRNIRSLRVNATAQNLWTITNYTGLDPEVNTTGLTPGIDGRTFFPRTTVFSLGVNLGF